MNIDITWTCSACPLQAEGSIDGKAFYFRARGEHWSIGIGGDVVGDPEWYWEEKWGDGPFAAGWMPQEIGEKLIELAATYYRAGMKQKMDNRDYFLIPGNGKEHPFRLVKSESKMLFSEDRGSEEGCTIISVSHERALMIAELIKGMLRHQDK